MAPELLPAGPRPLQTLEEIRLAQIQEDVASLRKTLIFALSDRVGKVWAQESLATLERLESNIK